MKPEAAAVYRCPYSGSRLDLIVGRAEGEQVISGALVNASGQQYPITDGVPDFRDLARDPMGESEARQFEYYQSMSGAYDAAPDWLFATFCEDEETVRRGLIDQLPLEDAGAVVEIGAGTCRDSVLIAPRMRRGARLFLQDFAPSILSVGRERMANAQAFDCEIEYFIGGAAHLPFADGTNDCVYTFGAFNVFPDLRACLSEMTRTARKGGRIVFFCR